MKLKPIVTDTYDFPTLIRNGNVFHGHSFITAEDSEFLKGSLGAVNLSFERLPISCTSKIYRLRFFYGVITEAERAHA